MLLKNFTDDKKINNTNAFNVLDKHLIKLLIKNKDVIANSVIPISSDVHYKEIIRKRPIKFCTKGNKSTLGTIKILL